MVAVIAIFLSLVHPSFSTSRTDLGKSDTTLRSTDYLEIALQHQDGRREGGVVERSYRSIVHRLYHSPRPWQTYTQSSSGRIWSGAERFCRADTIRSRGNEYVTLTQFRDDTLLVRNYWSDRIANPDQEDVTLYALEVARFDPVPLMRHLLVHSVFSDLDRRPGYALYHTEMADQDITLAVRCDDGRLSDITREWNDDMLGDRSEQIEFVRYDGSVGEEYPAEVLVHKIHGIVDTIQVRSSSRVAELPQLLERPAEYRVEVPAHLEPQINRWKVSDHLYAIDLLHTDSRSYIVEFSTFLVVIEAPFNSSNGELILEEAARIAPDKPVRYFAFGHHHPWYLGGLRSFVVRGIPVIASSHNADYVRELAAAPHTRQPDSLQNHPVEIRIAMLDTLQEISDGTISMQIVQIGERSAHTDDYLLFYFPAERILLEGDLADIHTAPTSGAASVRQIGLYREIVDRKLDVERILQSWPVGSDEIRNDFTFRELESTIPKE